MHSIIQGNDVIKILFISKRSNSARIDKLDKFFKRTVKSSFHIIGEKTGG